jgi:hypothetical protein
MKYPIATVLESLNRVLPMLMVIADQLAHRRRCSQPSRCDRVLNRAHRSDFDRHNVVSVTDLKDAALKLDATAGCLKNA